MNVRLPAVVVAAIVLCHLPGGARAGEPIKLELVEVKKVWDEAPHNAFTDLIRFKDKWFMTFREATTHMYDEPAGRIRVLASNDGRSWTSAALVKYGTEADDLRDPKLSMTPEGRLLLIAALAPKEDHDRRVSYAWLSDDGTCWDGPTQVGEPDWWLWRVVWRADGAGYALAYRYGVDPQERSTRLYRTTDGLHYETLAPRMCPEAGTGEASMLFRADGTVVAVLRGSGKGRTAQVGTSQGDYTQWTCRSLPGQIGGPHLIELPDGTILAAGRLYDGKVRTSLGLLEPEAGRFTELLALPSGGDTSYPGLVWHDDVLWVSYYSKHEGRASIYLAKVKVLPGEK